MIILSHRSSGEAVPSPDEKSKMNSVAKVSRTINLVVFFFCVSLFPGSSVFLKYMFYSIYFCRIIYIRSRICRVRRIVFYGRTYFELQMERIDSNEFLISSSMVFFLCNTSNIFCKYVFKFLFEVTYLRLILYYVFLFYINDNFFYV